MTPYVRSASLTNFADVAGQFGLDALALVREVGLPSRCLEDPDLKVPAVAVGRLLEIAAQRAREPAFGLLMAQSRRLSNLGPLGLLIRDEPTLRGALEALIRHLHDHNEALVSRIEQNGNLVIIREDSAVEGMASPRQSMELAVGVMLRVIAFFMGASWRPRLVCFSHRAPANLEVHRRVLGGAVEFGHEFNGIVCDARDLDTPNPAADPVMARYAKRLLEHDAVPRTRLTDRVRQLVVLTLPNGYCSVEVIAQHLGIDRRTVARRLRAEGTTFSDLVDGVRSDLLAHYLDDGGRPLAAISALLGFSAPSAFSRWHSRRFGTAARTRPGWVRL